MNAYQAIEETAVKVGWPVQFRTDLEKWDRQSIGQNPGRAFVWALYENGTHIMFAGRTDKAGNTARNMVRVVAECFPGSRFYFWDGRYLRPCRDAEHARDLMVAHEETEALQ